MFSFRTRIFFSVLLVSLLSIGIAVIYGKAWLERSQLQAARERLVYETRLAGVILDKLGPQAANLPELARILDMPDERLSLLDARGTVLGDTASEAQPVTRLDNHADRPEIQQALATGQGFAIRPSGTLDLDLAYAATRLEDGRLLRLSVPLENLRRLIESRLSVFSQIGLFTAALSLLLAVLLSGALRRSLNRMIAVVEGISLGNFQRRLRRIPGSEFAPLAEAVNRMAENIEQHMRAAADQTAQLESILDTMSDGVLVLGPRGRIRRCNRALARNFPEAAAARGAQVVEVIPSPALQEAVDDMLAAPEGECADAHGKPCDQSEKVQRHLHLDLPSGQVMSVCLSRPAGPDRHLGAVAVFHDITELVRLERVRRDFAANVSHELRTPLTAIQGYAETLISLDASPECRRFGEIILKNGACLTRMVEDLLSLARLEGKNGSLELAPTDPREAVAQARGMCREALERRDLRLEEDIPSDCRVMASLPHLTQVFRNLLENACRYAPEGSAVRIGARRSGSGEQAEVVFRVTDHGPGIPAEDLERVFERFYQVERHRGQASTGLGLAICKHIVERHNGRIRAESPAQDGSTAIVFSLAPAEVDHDEKNPDGAAT
ncbi:ATP-binding protein [Desulfovibrio sp. ZJ200]|uniref:ATP-binding protein n=1 Tax=Desulfovibrio sp. ZJ200 TaxID=2709792 RepID=UPI0013EDE825|nr:ATP-binding protein [Desulfovibrio sp. ZJ200]